MTDIRIRRARLAEIAAIVDVVDDACALHARAGIVFAHPRDHPYVLAEVAGWTRSVEQGLAEVAVDSDDAPIGIAIYALVDGEPYLDQLSVRCAWMGRGIGRRLLRTSMAWAAGTGGPGLREKLRLEREALPLPDEPVAMGRSIGPADVMRPGSPRRA